MLKGIPQNNTSTSSGQLEEERTALAVITRRSKRNNWSLINTTTSRIHSKYLESRYWQKYLYLKVTSFWVLGVCLLLNDLPGGVPGKKGSRWFAIRVAKVVGKATIKTWPQKPAQFPLSWGKFYFNSNCIQFRERFSLFSFDSIFICLGRGSGKRAANCVLRRLLK